MTAVRGGDAEVIGIVRRSDPFQKFCQLIEIARLQWITTSQGEGQAVSQNRPPVLGLSQKPPTPASKPEKILGGQFHEVKPAGGRRK